MANIAALGPKGTYTDEVAHQFKKDKISYTTTITQVFDEVASGKADYGVVPIENSIEGSVSETIECLRNYDVVIYAELYHKIRHVLAGIGRLLDVKEIRSHPQAVAQCMGKLKTLGKLPEITTKLENGRDYSTAAAMESVAMEKDPSIAAIGSRQAAEEYGLRILADNLSDAADNETRFFVISKKEHAKTGRDKTSIIVAIKHEAGSLYNLLGVFAKAGINLTKIESRPMKDKRWEYLFLIDLEGHEGDASVKKALGLAKDNAIYFKMLGSYPRG